MKFVVKEKRAGLGWVEWAPDVGVYIDLDQMKKLREMGGLKNNFVERQPDGRYLVVSIQNKIG